MRAPKEDAIAEWSVRTVRAERLDWLLILNRRHLERALRVYVDHYGWKEVGHRSRLARLRDIASNGSTRFRRSAVRGRLLVVETAVLMVAGALLIGAAGAGDVRIEQRAFHSRALEMRLRFAVSLPAGYEDGARYPVVYFLHGLPASPSDFQGIGFVRRALDGLTRRAIVVAPQAATETDSDPEYLDWGAGRNWETALARELPEYVDRHFRTIRDRRGRALIGLSAGGYGATLIGLHHLDEFSVIESWSGYQRPTDPAGTATINLGSAAANARASARSFIPLLQDTVRLRPTFIGFYVGARDSRFRTDNVRFHQQLQAARIRHVFRLYDGGHDQALWSAHAAEWLQLALANLSEPAP